HALESTSVCSSGRRENRAERGLSPRAATLSLGSGIGAPESERFPARCDRAPSFPRRSRQQGRLGFFRVAHASPSLSRQARRRTALAPLRQRACADSAGRVAIQLANAPASFCKTYALTDHSLCDPGLAECALRRMVHDPSVTRGDCVGPARAVRPGVRRDEARKLERCFEVVREFSIDRAPALRVLPEEILRSQIFHGEGNLPAGAGRILVALELSVDEVCSHGFSPSGPLLSPMFDHLEALEINAKRCIDVPGSSGLTGLVVAADDAASGRVTGDCRVSAGVLDAVQTKWIYYHGACSFNSAKREVRERASW